MSNYHLLPLDIIVTLNGTVMENPFISETIVKFKINSLVYIEKKKKKVDINFNAYHKTTERHLKPISKKLNCVAKIAQQIMDNNSSTNETKKRKETNTLKSRNIKIPKLAQLAVSQITSSKDNNSALCASFSI
ncbi:1590_t:CDS:2, partial [Entrophospora sp. SA101]